MEALLAMLLSEKMSADLGGGGSSLLARGPAAEQMRQKIEADMGR